MSRSFDSPWKEALDEELEPLLAILTPDLHAAIDWSVPPESLDTQLAEIAPDAEMGPTVADKLVRVALLDGGERWLLVHIEVQSQPDPTLAERMFVYFYRIRDRYNRDVVSVAILGDDRPTWRPTGLTFEAFGCRLAFEFRAIKLLDLEATAEAATLAGNPLGLFVAAHLASLRTHGHPEDRFASKWSLIRRLYEGGLTAERVRGLYRLIDWLLELPKDLTLRMWATIEEYAGAKIMPYVTSTERLCRELGLQEGLINAIELGLELRFGTAPIPLMAMLAEISDPAVLKTLRDRLKSVASIAEFTAHVETASQGR